MIINLAVITGIISSAGNIYWNLGELNNLRKILGIAKSGNTVPISITCTVRNTVRFLKK